MPRAWVLGPRRTTRHQRDDPTLPRSACNASSLAPQSLVTGPRSRGTKETMQPCPTLSAMPSQRDDAALSTHRLWCAGEQVLRCAGPGQGPQKRQGQGQGQGEATRDMNGMQGRVDRADHLFGAAERTRARTRRRRRRRSGQLAPRRMCGLPSAPERTFSNTDRPNAHCGPDHLGVIARRCATHCPPVPGGVAVSNRRLHHLFGAGCVTSLWCGLRHLFGAGCVISLVRAASHLFGAPRSGEEGPDGAAAIVHP